MSLERVIRDASSRLSGLTLWQDGAGWQGNARDRRTNSWVIAYDADPVEALLKAIDNLSTPRSGSVVVGSRRDEDLI